MECPICKKEFNEKTGRRPKRFCSDGCKVKFWNAFKKANTKPREPQIQDLNEFTNQVPNLTKEPPKSNYTITANREEILKQIEKIREEKLPEHRNTSIGRKSWAFEQSNRIKSLQKQLF